MTARCSAATGLTPGGTLIEIGGGSVFCACLRESFVAALRSLRQRDEDLVIVEASGMSDPATVDRMLRLSGLDADFEHDSTICLFDPVKSLKLAHVLEVIPRQLASASVAVLTKPDLATEQEIAAARAYISAREPDLPLVAVSHGRLELSALPAGAVRAFSFGFNTPETRPDAFSIDAVNCTAADLVAALEKEDMCCGSRALSAHVTASGFFRIPAGASKCGPTPQPRRP